MSATDHAPGERPGPDAGDPGEPGELPRGLVLFAPDTPARYRRRRLIFLAIWGAAWVSLLWPVNGWFAGPRPMVLGLPLAMAWSALWMLVLLAALVWLYRAERTAEAAPAAGASNPREEAGDPR